MPCFCWYEPSSEDKKELKKLAVEIVKKIKRLEMKGDPIGCTLEDVLTLIKHLYNPNECKEKNGK